MVVLSSVASARLVLVLISNARVVDGEARRGARDRRRRHRARADLAQLSRAPDVRHPAGAADYERRLRDSKLADPVLVVPPAFESELVRGEVPAVELVSSSANQRAQGSTGRGWPSCAASTRSRRPCGWPCAASRRRRCRRCWSTSATLADPATRAAQLTSMVPFFVLMAVLYGALNAALDTTAGERERGSLEPLLMNPTPRRALVLGKWARWRASAC
jgi:sodium transport system permease protein